MQIKIMKFFYGDIPENTGGGQVLMKAVHQSGEDAVWPLWEIFIRSKQGLDHKHAGSLHASDARMAIENARDVYTRRQEGISLWAIDSSHIHSSEANDTDKSKKISSGSKEEDPLWEVFTRSKQGLDFKQAGSLHAPNAAAAIESAHQTYAQGKEGVGIWVVESKHLHASDPADEDMFFEPAVNKTYRHPTFYELPDAVKHM